MPCYHPIPALKQPDGKLKLFPRALNATKAGEPTFWLPCGKCLGCREIQQQQLAIRLLHESQSASHRTFLTLTYDDEHEPHGLKKDDLQRFWKRLRKTTENTLKYLACGEYGDKTQRPHYHAAVLGLPVTDAKAWSSENYRSPFLEATWSQGIVTVSELTTARARYVAGYVLKKAGYKKQTYCDEDGVELEPPFRVLSKGLGKKWLEQYQTDLRHGYLQHEGAKHTIPRYYKDIIKNTNQKLHEYIEQQKKERQTEQETPDRERLRDAETIREQQIRQSRQQKQL